MGFVEGAVESGTGTCICMLYTIHTCGMHSYIEYLCVDVAGVPGTGKTATVHEVIRHLQYRVEQKVV